MWEINVNTLNTRSPSDYNRLSLASGYTSEHKLSQFQSPEIGRDAAKRASGIKYLMLTLTLVCVAAAGLPVVIQFEAYVRWDQRLTKRLTKYRIMRV